RGVPPLGRCSPADRRLAPLPTPSRSSTVTLAQGILVVSSRAARQPAIPAPTTAIAGPAIALGPLELFAGWLGHPLDEGGQRALGADAAQPVQDALAAPGVQAEVRVGQAALPAGGVLQEDVAVRGPVPADGEALVDPVLLALPLQPATDGLKEIQRRGPETG